MLEAIASFRRLLPPRLNRLSFPAHPVSRFLPVRSRPQPAATQRWNVRAPRHDWRMRPALKPGLLAVWRNRDTVQIGIDPRRAIALTGMRGAAVLLGLLDGSRDLTQIMAAAAELGISAEGADRVIALLTAGGALHDFPLSTYRAMPHGLRTRLAPELATAALAHGDGDGGARVLARRQNACVRVEGMSRVGLCVASLLTASGIGMVISTGRSPGTGGAPGSVPPAAAPPHAAAPPPAAAPPHAAAPPPADGLPPACALPPTGRAGPAGLSRPDLVVLADIYRRELPDQLKRQGVPHLAVAASEAIGVVGPLVTPGSTACLRCLDLTRAERDPAWPLILAQLTGGGADPPACDTVLAAAVASQAAAQALAFVDRPASANAVTNGTLELVLPDWQWRRRTWLPHDRCDCGRRSTL